MKRLLIVLLSLLLVVGCSNNPNSTTTTTIASTTTMASATTTELGVSVMNRIATFETSMGTFKIELYEDKAPITTKNFIELTNKGYYNGLIFHRIIKDFMIQGGDPKGDGTGGPGYTIKDEFVASLKHDKGVISMANTGQPNTGGSQFFITLAPTPWLNGKHAVFGKVVEGIEVVDKIGKVPTNANDKPLTNVVINKITIQ